MGNAPSTPPPLVSINAPGNDVLVPYGTSLYVCPPRTPGYHPPHMNGDCSGATCKGAECRGGAPRGPVYSRVGTRPRRKRHGHAEPDVNIREYEEESESTELGEMPIRRKESKMQDMRGLGRRGVLGPYDVDPRSSSAPAGYAGLRGGQGPPGVYRGMEDLGANGMMLHPGMNPGMYSNVYPPGAGTSPHMSVPPQYASHEPMPRHPHGSTRNTNAYPSHPPRPPPPSTTSATSSPKPRSRPLPSAIQAAIDEAVQKNTGLAHTPSSPLTRSRTSPATCTKDKIDGLGDGIDTCICTTNCKCRKSERAIKWYEGMANIGGSEVPVRAKLNTRYVLKNDLGKDCGDHSGCKKKASSSSGSSSSSSDTEVSKSRKNRKTNKKAKKTRKADKLDNLQAELDKMKQAAAMNKGGRYGPTSFAGYSPRNLEAYDPETMRRLRMMEIGNPYGTGRVDGMDATVDMQGVFDPMTMRNPRLPRVPPKAGMWMRSEHDGLMGAYGDIEGVSPLDPYARPGAMRGKGRIKTSMPPKGRPRFVPRGGLPNSDSELNTLDRSGDREEGAPMGGRPRRSRPFELDGIDVSLGPRRQSTIKDFGSEKDDGPVMYNLPRRGVGDKNDSGSTRNKLSRISPPWRRGGVRKGRTAGKQAHVETDDDEDY